MKYSVEFYLPVCGGEKEIRKQFFTKTFARMYANRVLATKNTSYVVVNF